MVALPFMVIWFRFAYSYFKNNKTISEAKPYNNEFYFKKEIKTPAATAEPITPEILLAIAYCKI